MSLFGKRWEPDGRDALSPKMRMLLSIVVSGVLGYLLEYIGIEVFHAFTNANPNTIYGATAIWALALGPLLVLLRKAALWVPMAIVGVLFAFAALFNHYHFIIWEFANGAFVDTGKLWAPRIWEFRDGQLFGLRHPFLIALVAGIIETVVVPASVWTQKLLTLGLRKKAGAPLEEIAPLFASSVGPLSELKPKRDFGFYFLRFIFLAYGVYFSYQILALLISAKGLPAVNMFFINPPETLNTFMKIVLMLSLATVGAFNAGVRREASVLLAIGHAISVGASLWLYFAYPPNPLFPGDHPFLLASVAGDGVLILVLLYFAYEARPPKENFERIEDVELRSPASTLMRTFFLVFAVLFTAFSAAIVYFRAFGSPEAGLGAVFGGPDPLVSNSLTKYGTLATLGYFLYAKPGLRRFFVPTLIVAFSVSVLATFIYGLKGTTVLMSRLGTTVELPWFMVQHIIVDGGGLMLLLALRRMQYQVDFQITSLRPASAECAMALHRAFRASAQEPETSAREVLRRIDEHIVDMRGRRRGLLGFPFWLMEHVFPTMLFFRPAFSTMSRAEQRWLLRRHMLRPNYEREQAPVPALAELRYQIADILHALVSFAYFTSARGHAQIGYVLPDARERLQGEIATQRPPDNAQEAPLPKDPNDSTANPPKFVPPVTQPLLKKRLGVASAPAALPDEVDYCIIGSGAAGGLMAYRLAAEKGKDYSILVLERGGFYSPRQDFSDDEMRMTRMLYTEGGLQTTRSFDFRIMQGECVGGTTVINNALCLQMPQISRNEWDVFGIDMNALQSHYGRVAQEINIDTLTDEAVNHNVERLFSAGVAAYNAGYRDLEKVSSAARMKTNFSNCLGCGLCNIGCRRMRKLSVLETYIPWAQAHGALVAPNAGLVKCEAAGANLKKITSVIVRNANGDFQRIRVRKAAIIAAGAVASSRILMRSNLGGEHVGRNLSCNFALPPLVEFSENVDAFDGAQMTMYAAAESHDAIFETTFNPPGAYAVAVPIYFDRHAEMMNFFRRAVNFTALVGSDPCGAISLKRDVLFGRAIEWQQTKNDLLRIKSALATLVRITKAAGAKRMFLPTHPVLEVPLAGDVEPTLAHFERALQDPKYFSFYTAHPQGGNLMASPDFNERVVESDFRVRGCENLYLCDASVFPRSIRVNPQWTIMALASQAGELVAANT